MAAKHRLITVHVADSEADMATGESIYDEFSSVAKAREAARWWLTEEAMNRIERSSRFSYSEVRVNGQCEYQFYRPKKMPRSPEHLALLAAHKVLCSAFCRLHGSPVEVDGQRLVMRIIGHLLDRLDEETASWGK